MRRSYRIITARRLQGQGGRVWTRQKTAVILCVAGAGAAAAAAAAGASAHKARQPTRLLQVSRWPNLVR